MRKPETDTPPKAAIVTLGCPMNQVDSERIIGGLVSLGFEIVPEEEAEVAVVNTCGFIESAREESIGTILSVAELKRKGALKSLVVAGCLAERYRVELERELTEADAVVGLDGRESIPGLCLELLRGEKRTNPDTGRTIMGPLHSAYLKIAEGCDNRCAYCAIPSIRGGFRSIEPGAVLDDARDLAALGARELILIAQDTANYGVDLDGASLASLLEKLNDVDGIRWIRVLYAHPAHITDGMIDAMAGLPKVVPYLDMPLQHISDSVLRRMGRPVTAERVSGLIGRLRERIDGLVLRTTLMAGYPGEREEDFDALMDFVERVRFERLGAFVFSPEEGTVAAGLDVTVPEEIAAERYERLMETQARIAGEFHRTLVGAEFEMIVDDIDGENGTVTGRTYMDAPEIDGNLVAPGSVEEGVAFLRVRITDASAYDLEGEIVSAAEPAAGNT